MDKGDFKELPLTLVLTLSDLFDQTLLGRSAMHTASGSVKYAPEWHDYWALAGLGKAVPGNELVSCVL